jgi:hypothetical protein
MIYGVCTSKQIDYAPTSCPAEKAPNGLLTSGCDAVSAKKFKQCPRCKDNRQLKYAPGNVHVKSTVGHQL